MSKRRGAKAGAGSENGYREEFLNDVHAPLADRIPPDLWKRHWSLTTPQRREIYVGLIAGLRENLAWFPRYQAYLREHQPPALILWAPQGGYIPEGAAHAYLRDLPNAELHLLEGGHWLFETHQAEATALVRDFLDRCAGGQGRFDPAAAMYPQVFNSPLLSVVERYSSSPGAQLNRGRRER